MQSYRKIPYQPLVQFRVPCGEFAKVVAREFEKDRVANRHDRCRLDLVGEDPQFPCNLTLHDLTDDPFSIRVVPAQFPKASADHDEQAVRWLARAKQGLSARDMPPGQPPFDVAQYVLGQVTEQVAQHLDYLVAVEQGHEDVPQPFGNVRTGGEMPVKAAFLQSDQARGGDRPNLRRALASRQRPHLADDIASDDCRRPLRVAAGRAARRFRRLDYFEPAGSNEVKSVASLSVKAQDFVFVENDPLQLRTQTIQARSIDGPQEGAVRDDLHRIHDDRHTAPCPAGSHRDILLFSGTVENGTTVEEQFIDEFKISSWTAPTIVFAGLRGSGTAQADKDFPPMPGE